MRKTCAAFYSCQETEYRKLSDLVLKSIDETDMDNFEACREKRNGLEESIFAHSTTIECMDTPEGPHFGG